jgi:hypothetical protein
MNTAYGSCSGSPGTPVFTNIVVNGAKSINSVSGAYTEIHGVSSSNLGQVRIDTRMTILFGFAFPGYFLDVGKPEVGPPNRLADAGTAGVTASGQLNTSHPPALCRYPKLERAGRNASTDGERASRNPCS